MSNNKEFKHESFQDRIAVGNYLSELMKGVENGVLHFVTGKEEFYIYPDELLYIEIKVKKKGEKNRISLKIEWKEGVDSSVDENCMLHINGSG